MAARCCVLSVQMTCGDWKSIERPCLPVYRPRSERGERTTCVSGRSTSFWRMSSLTRVYVAEGDSPESLLMIVTVMVFGSLTVMKKVRMSWICRTVSFSPTARRELYIVRYDSRQM